MLDIGKSPDRLKLKVSGGAAPLAENLSSPRDIGFLEVSAEGGTSTRSGRSDVPSRIIAFRQPRNTSQSQLKNYRRNPEYKSCAVGQRLPFATRALSGWYVPSPDLISRLWVYLNGRNAEYSGHFGLYVSRPALSRTGRKRVLVCADSLPGDLL